MQIILSQIFVILSWRDPAFFYYKQKPKALTEMGLTGDAHGGSYLLRHWFIFVKKKS
jgi:hypothetical protein